MALKPYICCQRTECIDFGTRMQCQSSRRFIYDTCQFYRTAQTGEVIRGTGASVEFLVTEQQEQQMKEDIRG